ncbi:MAG: non-lysosomal glucosylceramidase, partial [Spirochaetales bacterium]|nr:non-lysosomal glucosylceramidase [Spirochaetales bacterium]
YWRDVTDPAGLKNRPLPRYNGGISGGTAMTAALACRLRCPPGRTRRARFVLAWYVPLCRRFWDRQPVGCEERFTPEEERFMAQPWRNWYATVWDSAAAVAHEALTRWDALHAPTRAFRDALFSSSIPPHAIDAIAGPLSVLKSATVLRVEDGSFYGWEGTGTDVGSCEGSCTHVWSYAQALAFLFPRLERSMRTVEYTYNLNPEGAMAFRTMLPLGSPRWPFRPCVDGQFGTVLRVYREWKISGDERWLRSIWQGVRVSISFAWNPDNGEAWDPEATGVITGRQHHTLDMELFGANSWLTGMYLAALKGAAEMAEVLEDGAFAERCRAVYTRGRERLNRELFNGRYYCQRLDLEDTRVLARFDQGGGDMFGNSMYDTYWDAEYGQIKYQLGEGISIDHALGQWHAGLYGLGDVFDPEQLTSSLKALYEHNTKRTMRRYANPCRVFSLNDEDGLVMCAWPEGSVRPGIPIPYAQETMTGFEYAAASLMIQSGMVDEGLRIVRAVRDRYDGRKRNPWNEIECGSNYARATASYSILLSLSGFVFDAAAQTMGFLPRIKAPWRFFWSALGSWGTAELTVDRFELCVEGAPLRIFAVVLPSEVIGRAASASVDGERLDIEGREEAVTFGRIATVRERVTFHLAP